jgi:hypothetical protein
MKIFNALITNLEIRVTNITNYGLYWRLIRNIRY